MARLPVATVAAYLASVPVDRRPLVAALRDAVNRRLPAGYEEGIQYGMIGWYVPHALFPAGYHCDPKQPLPFAGLGNTKGHAALHLMCLYMDPSGRAAFEAAWKATGKRFDMGGGCVRVKRLEDVPLDVVTNAIASIPVAKHVACYAARYAERAGASAKDSKAAEGTRRAATKAAVGRGKRSKPR